MAARVWQSVKGYVMISMDGLGLERVLNEAMRAGIRFGDVRRESRVRLTARLYVRDFYALRKVCRKRRVRIRILEKHSIPLRLWGRLAPKALIWGWVPVLLLLLVASRFVWFVRVEGCYRVTQEEVLLLLEQQDVKPGTPVGELEHAAISRAVMAGDERIAWAGVRRAGVILTVRIVEAEEAPEEPEKKAYNIWAAEEGVILSITATDGEAMVRAGDVVRKGELLISGAGGEAEGTVIARVSRQAQASQEPSAQGLVPSGVWVEKCRVFLWGWEIFPLEAGYDGWVFQRERTRYIRALLPIEVAAGRLMQMEEGTVQLERGEMERRARLQAQAALLAEIPESARIVSSTTKIDYDKDGNAVAIAVIQTEEDIGAPG